MSEIAALDGASLAQDVSQEAFWRQHFPGLSLPGDNRRRDTAKYRYAKIDPQAQAWLGARMRDEGYFQFGNDTFAELAPKLADAVRTCVKLDIPPAFIFLFDEAWSCFQSLNPLLAGFLGEEYAMLPDFWAWHVDPQAGQSGWRPHRDKGRMALRPDGTPVSLTVWAPLADATPLTSCMYLLPINRDPVYNTENEASWQIDITAIRALPGKAGDFFCWNQAVLHWGSQSSPFAPHPRISMALEFQRSDIKPFNTPLLAPFEPLDFGQRLKLVGKQILQYRHMYPLAARFESLAQKLVAG